LIEDSATSGPTRLAPTPGILVLHPGEARPDAILTLMEAFLAGPDLESLARCNAVVEPEATRVRQPATP
jgi:hypothetical protein